MSSDRSGNRRTVRLGEILKLRREHAQGNEQLLSVTRTRGVISQEDVGRRDSSSNDKTTYWKVHPEDIVYNTMRMWQGVSGRSDLHGIVSPAYTVCRVTDDADPRFVASLLKHSALVQDFYRYSQGLVSDTWNLRYSSFSEVKAEIPELAEQQRIAEILNAVDMQISATQEVIAKQKQVNAGLLSRLFSSFDTPSRPLSEFLATRPRNGFSPNETEHWTGVVSLGLGCLTMEGFVPRQLKNAPSKDVRYASAWLSHGDLLISRSNTFDLVGLVGRYQDIGTPCIYPDLMMKLTPNKLVRPEFLELALRHGYAREQIKRISQGTSGSMVKISAASLIKVTLKIPDLADQDRVLRAFTAQNAQVNALEREIAKLRLVKQGLMDDLLTGRVRVPV